MSTRFSQQSMEMSGLTRDGGMPKPSRETKFSGANADREKFIFPVQLTTCTCIHTYIHTYIHCHEYHTNTEDTGSLGYNLVCYITSRIGWVSLKGIYRDRCTLLYVMTTHIC